MHESRVKAAAALVLLTLAAGVWAAVTPVAGREGLLVHEWGTFSCFSGSDGALLRFYPANTDLPSFVYQGGANRKDAYSGLVSLETPVLYFYSARPLTASVRAEFHNGAFTEWYPWADRSRHDVLSWASVQVRPEGQVRLPVGKAASHYYAAREAEATPVEVTVTENGKERREHEGFLFYRGVGSVKPPLDLTATGQDKFTLRVLGKEPIASAFLMDVRSNGVRYRQLGPLAAGDMIRTELPESQTTVKGLREAVVGVLTIAGLYDKEAEAMVKTWETTWFSDHGTRVLYVLPSGWTSRTLPLQVTPTPTTLVRVLVGRQDILTPEGEEAVDQLVQKLSARSEKERTTASATLAKLGRFAGPAQKQAEKRLAQRR